MAEFRQLIITNKGQALMAKMIAGSSNIKFTNVGTSSMVYTDEEIVEITNVDVRQRALVSKVTRTNDVAVKIESAITNSELTTGYMMNTIVLYAEDPDEGEIVYAVCGASSPGYMPPYNGVSTSGAYFKLITTVGNAHNVTLEIDPAAVATIGDIEDLQKQINDASDKIEVLDKNLYNPNLLINSNFASGSLVNQRGKTEYSGNVYTVDMWRLTYGLDFNAQLLVETDCVKLQSTGIGAGAFTDFTQPFENILGFKNKKITVTIDYEISNGGQVVFKGDGLGGQTVTGNGTRQKQSFTYTYLSDVANVFTVRLRRTEINSIGDYIKIYSIKVELGEVATPFVDDDPTIKLTKCQRYLNVLKNDKTPFLTFANGICRNTTMGLFIFNITPMRGRPTLAFRELNDFRISKYTVSDLAYITPSKMSLGYDDETKGVVSLIVEGIDLVKGSATQLQFFNAPGSYLILSAEL